MTTISDPSIMPPWPSVKLKQHPVDGQVTCPHCDHVFNVRGFGRHKQVCHKIHQEEELAPGVIDTVRIHSTVLTQPGTPVSFQGMFICSLFDFRKLWIFRCFPFPENSGTPTFLISGNSRLRCFPIFLYYVITLFSCLHLSLVTPSAVGNTSLSLDPQFPCTLPYCLAYVTLFPLLCTSTTLAHSLVISICILYLDNQN